MDSLQYKTLGFIGLGAMGGRMARNLVRAGYRLIAYDIRPEALAACTELGASAADDAASVVRQSDLVMTSLVAPVYLQVAEETLLPNARAGQVFIDFSTVPAPDTRKLEWAFEAKGATLLDAPVSGWITGAESGQLSIFVGGDEATARACWPLFEVLGNPEHIIYGGTSGKGQALKVVQQLKNRLLEAARLEVLAFGARSGLEPELVLRALDVDSEGSDPYARLYRLIREGKAEGAGLLSSEWAYYLAEAEAQGFAMPVLSALHSFLEGAPVASHDEQGRPEASLWHELMKHKRT